MTDYEKLTDGEFNTLVATQVMGWTQWSQYWSPKTNIRQAWEVVQKFCSLGYDFNVGYCAYPDQLGGGRGWHCALIPPSGEAVQGHARDPALAICYAGLKATENQT